MKGQHNIRRKKHREEAQTFGGYTNGKQDE